MTERTPWLDGWRGIAILLVLFEHFVATALRRPWLRTGHLGVDLFFALSGFLMARILFEQRIALRVFYKRRFARTLPVFYLYLIAMIVVALLLQKPVNWTHAAATAVFLRSYVGEHIWTDPLALGHIWSLNVEEHAYLLLSLVVLFAGQRSERVARWTVTILSVVPLLFQVYFRHAPDIAATPYKLRTECAIFPLLAASSMFLWIRARDIRISHASFVALLVALLLLATTDVIGLEHWGSLIRYLLLPLALAAAVNFLHCAPPSIRRALSARWLTWFGVCSYSLYLWHYPFFYLMLVHAWPHGVCAAAACSFALAISSFYWFERPMRAFLRGERRSRDLVPDASIEARSLRGTDGLKR